MLQLPHTSLSPAILAWPGNGGNGRGQLFGSIRTQVMAGTDPPTRPIIPSTNLLLTSFLPP